MKDIAYRACRTIAAEKALKKACNALAFPREWIRGVIHKLASPPYHAPKKHWDHVYYAKDGEIREEVLSNGIIRRYFVPHLKPAEVTAKPVKVKKVNAPKPAVTKPMDAPVFDPTITRCTAAEFVKGVL